MVEQMPDLQALELRSFDEGFDNSLWRLGDDYLVRLPRRAVAIGALENEIKWLPVLAAQLPLDIPVPLRVGLPSGAFPSCWTVTSWFEGATADVAKVRSFSTIAGQIGAFLRSLHVAAPQDSPINPFRGGPLRERSDAFEERIVVLPAGLDEGIVRDIWMSALREPEEDSPPVWIHGDLHPANVVIDDDSISAVIDFGDLCAGDPATDLAGALMLLPDGFDENFVASYGTLESALTARSLGWAVLFSLMFIELGMSRRSSYYDAGRATLERITSRYC